MFDGFYAWLTNGNETPDPTAEPEPEIFDEEEIQDEPNEIENDAILYG